MISGKIAKDLFEIVWSEGGDPRQVVEARGMKQVTDTGAIEAAVDEIIAKNPDKVQQAKEKPTLPGWFVGQTMKANRRQGQPVGRERIAEGEARNRIRLGRSWTRTGSSLGGTRPRPRPTPTSGMWTPGPFRGVSRKAASISSCGWMRRSLTAPRLPSRPRSG